VVDACRKPGITEQTYDRSKLEYGEMRVDQAKRLKVLEQGNLQLKQIVANRDLDLSILKEVSSGKLLTQARQCKAMGNSITKLHVTMCRTCYAIGQDRSSYRRYWPQRDPHQEYAREPMARRWVVPPAAAHVSQSRLVL
jgi:hypothetical protein